MDRSNEYFKLLEATSIPQQKIHFQNTKNLFNEIENQLTLLESQNNLDQYLIDQKIKKINKLIEEIKNTAKENEKLGFNVYECTEIKIKKYLLRINKLKKEVNNLIIEDSKRRENFIALQEQEQVCEQKEEFGKDTFLRKRIFNEITELGHIVSDIALHVSLQGEEIERIDKTVNESQSFIKESFYEINRTWERVSEQRKRLLKFFTFWLILAFIFWYFKK